LVLGLFIHGERNQRRPHWPCTNSVDTNALTKLLIRKTSGEGNAGFLVEVWSSRSGRPLMEALLMMAPPDFHVGQGILGEVEVRVNVCVKGVEPLLRLL
jgi:hypothetical protein